MLDATCASECWKSVVGFEGLYEVSDQGNIRSVDRRVIRTDGQVRNYKGKPLKPRTSSGVAKVSLSRGPVVTDRLVARLVMDAFAPGPPHDTERIEHRNGDRFDNRLANLEYVTTSGRFWALVNKTDSCWLWTGKDSGQEPPYGRFSLNGTTVSAHRLAYVMCVGEIPPGLEIDHRCHVPLCVNPDHLRPTTRKQNRENFSDPHSNPKTRVRGVSKFDETYYRATVGHNGKRVYAVLFTDPEEAERAVIEQRKKYHTHNDLDRQP